MVAPEKNVPIIIIKHTLLGKKTQTNKPAKNVHN